MKVFLVVPLYFLTDCRLETDHNRPNISLRDRANNVVELMKKSPPEPENITFSEELSKLFPKANEKMVEQEDEISNLIKTLIKFLLKSIEVKFQNS